MIGIDFGLIVPDEGRTLREARCGRGNRGCRGMSTDLVKVTPASTASHSILRLAAHAARRKWVLEGEPEWEGWKKSWPGTWYGVRKFFGAGWKPKPTRCHIRVLLSKYRAYTPCPAAKARASSPTRCCGAWARSRMRAGVLSGAYRRFQPLGVNGAPAAHAPLTVHDLMLLPMSAAARFFDPCTCPQHARKCRCSSGVHSAPASALRARPLEPAPAAERPLGRSHRPAARPRSARASPTCARSAWPILTLDRQSRTLSGGEVQRINLTTALGTSLVNTLFVLDEPSIGLHPRDIGRVIEVMHRLHDAGSSLVVVEHDPQIMFAADRMLDMGPGPGERGGEVVFFGTPTNWN